ncbi:MAG: methyltransferase domain-containing protein [Candidatus Omnitrophica bacterium]|nr:methyltransferase domain-containing protein [Candidatus Omnitrophota bacterium]
MPKAVLVRHYGRLAARYDRRWQAYLAQTLGHALEALRVSGTERILDVGCGTGEFARMAVERFPKVSIVGVDAAPAMVGLAHTKLTGCSRATFQMSRAEALPFGAEEFDAVVCANTLHHLPAPRQALQEWVRVLRPGGRLIVVDWCRDFWHCRLMHYWVKLFDRTYTAMLRLGELRKLAEEFGLTVERADRFMAKPFYGMLCVSARKASLPAPLARQADEDVEPIAQHETSGSP